MLQYFKTTRSSDKVSTKRFSDISKIITALETALRAWQALHGIGKIAGGLVDNGDNPLWHRDVRSLPTITTHTSTRLGKNDCSYYKTEFHIGEGTKGRTLTLKKGPNTETVTKSFKNSDEDYQGVERRKQLIIKAGFNQKNFAVLMEDTFFTNKDYLKLYKTEKLFGRDFNRRTIERISKQKYGCATKRKNMLKLMNRMEYYSVYVKISIYTLKDITDDIRRVLQEVTYKPLARDLKPKNKDEETGNETKVIQNELEETVVNNDKRTIEIIGKIPRRKQNGIMSPKSQRPSDLLKEDILDLSEKYEDFSQTDSDFIDLNDLEKINEDFGQYPSDQK